MSDTITPRDAQFFYAHAGYSYPNGAAYPEQEESRVRNAERLAISHHLLAEAIDAGAARVTWEFDEYADADDDAGTREAWEAGNVEPYACLIFVGRGYDEKMVVVASLGGIWFETHHAGRDPYCDVVEAELALEAHMELAEALATRLEEEMRAKD